jgi:hypothetical protein
MQRLLAILALICLIGLTACGGGGFTPDTGPYNGTFKVGTTAIGTLTLTAAGTTLGGTGVLTHNEQPVNVSIAAVISSKTITGTVANVSLGNGNFVGTFTSVKELSGTFTYTDKGGVSTTTGTWSAVIAP